jgi:hypothetical protein
VTQFAITRNEYGEVWTSRAVRIVEGNINDAEHERDRIVAELGLPGGHIRYGVRRLPRPVDPSLPGYLEAANRMLWPHLYSEGVA